MLINATEFKSKCSSLLDFVVQTNEPILITRHGEVIAKVVKTTPAGTQPWMQLRGSGQYLGWPEESVLTNDDFEALR